MTWHGVLSRTILTQIKATSDAARTAKSGGSELAGKLSPSYKPVALVMNKRQGKREVMTFVASYIMHKHKLPK
jgi:hypothetical protein